MRTGCVRVRGYRGVMADSAARLLRLLVLLAGRPEWTGPELAARLEVTARTVRRDVERLRELGYPIRATPGTAGGYRLAPGATLPPLVLDDEQAVAVAVALRALASGGLTGVEESAVRALLVLEQVLPARLRRQVKALDRTVVTVPAWGTTTDPALLTDLASACDLHQQVRLGYTDREGGRTERLVEPYRLVRLQRRWYLMARDPAKDGWRTFRLDRIGSVGRTGRRFTPVELPDPARYVTTAVSCSPYRYRAVVLLGGPAEELAATFPPSVGLVEPVDEATCRLTVGADDLDMVAARLAALRVPLTVLEPPELLDRMQELAGRLAAAVAGRPTSPPVPIPADPAGATSG